MLDTLLQIGAHESVGKTEWDQLIYTPQTDKKSDKKDAKEIQYFVYYVVFDLDKMAVNPIEPVAQYDEHQPKLHCNLNIKGGNNMAYYLTVHFPKHFDQFTKTLFGKKAKEDEKIPTKGELFDLMEKENPDFRENTLAKVLEKVFELKNDFYQRFPDADKSTEFKIAANQKIQLLVSAVIWQAEGIDAITPIHQLDGYKAFIQNKLLPKTSVTNQKLCYATGEFKSDVSELAIPNRYSLNKMFVETTKNYASDFDKNKFGQNYQVSLEQQMFLEEGSKFLLDEKNGFKWRIAGIDHCILPQFSAYAPANQPLTRLEISERLDFLLGRSNFDLLNAWITKNAKRVQQETKKKPLYWLTFMGFESDGNFFKTINLVQSVNNQYFNRLIDVFAEVNLLFCAFPGIQWEQILAQGKNKFVFNFLTLYGIIPVRKDREKKNVALSLLQALLQGRLIEQSIVFQYFKELILCHRFDRYRSYTNIYTNDSFDYAVRNAVFQYAALIQILEKLNILKNNNMNVMDNELNKDSFKEYQGNDAAQKKRIAFLKKEGYVEMIQFLDRMRYNEDQKALFYIGQIVSNIAYAQVKADHPSKPILDKINYNGMDFNSLCRFTDELAKKTQEYNARKNVVPFQLGRRNDWLREQLTNHFRPVAWHEPRKADLHWDERMERAEGLFYLLLGYSYRRVKEEASSETDNSSDDTATSE
jgi:CRISPR-associated protein Csh1